MDFTANEGSGLNRTGGSNPPVSAKTPEKSRFFGGLAFLKNGASKHSVNIAAYMS